MRTFEGKLGDFFVPGDERSTWLHRLTIIRDDLRFEMGQLGVGDDESANEGSWRTTYFLRRITISISDACRILIHDVPKWIATVKSAPRATNGLNHIEMPTTPRSIGDDS